eukprot:1714109-Amphidinium_carterae.1
MRPKKLLTNVVRGKAKLDLDRISCKLTVNHLICCKARTASGPPSGIDEGKPFDESCSACGRQEGTFSTKRMICVQVTEDF